MKLHYVADDGQVFDTQQECLDHENKPALVSAIQDLFENVTEPDSQEVSGNYNHNVYYSETISIFIINHINKINKILNNPTVIINKHGWISNIGHDSYHYPKSLSHDTEIEVRYRNDTLGIGCAVEWNSSSNWKETDGCSTDIIAYRILTV